MTWVKSGLSLFLPFAGAYFVSYLFRVVNAPIAGTLIEEFDLNAAQLGVLTSVYSLTFAAVPTDPDQAASKPSCCQSQQQARWCSRRSRGSPDC